MARALEPLLRRTSVWADREQRQHARILFFTVTVSESWTVTMTVAEPSPGASTIEGLLEEFGAFLDRYVHARVS